MRTFSLRPHKKIRRELTPHKGSASNLKYLTRVRNVNVESEQSEDSLTRGRARTGHSQKIVPGLETFSHVRNDSPDLNEVRVQRLTMLETSSPDLSTVRVQRLVLVGTVNASPNEVRAHLQSVFLSVFRLPSSYLRPPSSSPRKFPVRGLSRAALTLSA